MVNDFHKAEYNLQAFWLIEKFDEAGESQNEWFLPLIFSGAICGFVIKVSFIGLGISACFF